MSSIAVEEIDLALTPQPPLPRTGEEELQPPQILLDGPKSGAGGLPGNVALDPPTGLNGGDYTSLPELLPPLLPSPEDHPLSTKSTRKGPMAAGTEGFGEWAGLRGRSIELSGYSGPLDLLLKLIRKNEVDIYDIPIASITEQYLAEIDAMEKRDLVVAGDFLLLAATLLEIKSAMMLPRPPPPEGDEEGLDPRAELVQHLLEYQAFQAAAEEFGRLEAQRRMVYGRPFFAAVLQEYGPAPAPAPNLNLDSLSRSLQRVLERLEEEGEPITSIPRQKIGLRLRIAGVLADLAGAGRQGMLLEELVRPQEGKLFVIVTFLALLELLRSGRIVVQETAGGTTHRFWAARFGLEVGQGEVGARMTDE